MLSKLSCYIVNLIEPIKKEKVFFFFVLLLLLPRTFYYFFTQPQKWFEWEYFPTLKFISIAVVFSYFFSALVYITKSNILKYIIYLLCYVLFFINIFLAVCFKAAVSPTTLMLILETNQTETKSFFSMYTITGKSLIVYVVMLIILFLNAKADNIIQKIKHSMGFKIKIARNALITLFLFFFLCGFCCLRIYPQLLACDTIEKVDAWNPGGKSSMDNITNFVFSCYDLNLLGKSLISAEHNTASINKYCHTIDLKRDSTNVVLVIGESFVKKHSSLYGYPHQTNPRLKKEYDNGRLFLFHDVISTATFTSASIRNIFSTNSVGDGEKWYDFPFFPAIFVKAGYHVYFWDNQYKPLSNQAFDFSLNTYLHSKAFERYYEASQHFISDIDGDLIEDFKQFKINNQLDKYNLLIIHLQGQHFDQKDHYPEGFESCIFSPDSVKRDETWMTQEKKQQIAHYDNATAYNDYIIRQIINMFFEESTVLVYLSDHGESIYDDGDYAGRKLNLNIKEEPNLLRLYHDIPFMVWCSDKYIKAYPEVISDIKRSQNRPFMIDNLFHLLVHLGGGIF